jgi:hypothetical protein
MKKTDVEITVGTVKSSYAEQEAKFQKEWKEREQAANVARKAAEEEEYRQRVLKVEEAKRLLQKKKEEKMNDPVYKGQKQALQKSLSFWGMKKFKPGMTQAEMVEQTIKKQFAKHEGTVEGDLKMDKFREYPSAKSIRKMKLAGYGSCVNSLLFLAIVGTCQFLIHGWFPAAVGGVVLLIMLYKLCKRPKVLGNEALALAGELKEDREMTIVYNQQTLQRNKKKELFRRMMEEHKNICDEDECKEVEKILNAYPNIISQENQRDLEIGDYSCADLTLIAFKAPCGC